MLPEEKALVERMKNRPFALIGINSDRDPKEKLQERLKAEGITWRNAIQGSTSGPIPQKWNVHGWPTIYLLDAKGVIRHKNARGKQLEEAIEALVKEGVTGATEPSPGGSDGDAPPKFR
jgi:hypothetical protein